MRAAIEHEVTVPQLSLSLRLHSKSPESIHPHLEDEAPTPHILSITPPLAKDCYSQGAEVVKKHGHSNEPGNLGIDATYFGSSAEELGMVKRY